MAFQRYIEGILTIQMFSWSIKWYIEGILRKQRYIHGILNDRLKVCDMVYQKYFKRNIKRD